jgi:Domain of unknown function (DUF4395)
VFAVRRIRPLTIPAATAPGARPAPGRWIDPRAQRLGAGASAITLLAAALLDAWPVVAVTGLALGLSAAAGTRWFLFSRPWPLLRAALRLRPSELEHEMPPRFAQALGAAFLGLGVAMLLAGARPWGWLPVAAVIALQALLAATGFCLGCRLFFLRWWIPDLFARAVGRGVRRESLVYVQPPRR